VKLEGRWPEYPDQLHKLAQKHHVSIPGMSLPLTREMLDAFEDDPSPPEVPPEALRKFAMGLTPKERAALNLNAGDPKSLNRLKNEYLRSKNVPGRGRRPDMIPPR
jgi:hypothetical protein